jgi:lysophospholipase L1-like esterase
MIIRRMVCTAALALATIASSQAVAGAAVPVVPTYFLSLGDSLAAGYQPAHGGVPAGDTGEGYADQLYASLKVNEPNLQLVKLGCTGETTTTMLSGGRCTTYPGGLSQVGAAGLFLAQHSGKVKYLTNDIGANDVQKCASTGSLDVSCAINGVTTLSTNLPLIVGALKTAMAVSGNNTAAFVGMNYYNPFVASYLNGFNGAFLAAVTSLVTYVVNTAEEKTYQAANAPVADVSSAFQSYDFFTFKDLPGTGPVPAPVYNICTLTYMCSVGDTHANQAGYKVIADAFAAKLTSATPGLT